MEITFDRVSKKFGRNEVIKDISFHIKSNTIVGLKGINGSGKTMIMRLIAGLIYPTHGKVLIILKLRENTEVTLDLPFVAQEVDEAVNTSGLNHRIENETFNFMVCDFPVRKLIEIHF